MDTREYNSRPIFSVVGVVLVLLCVRWNYVNAYELATHGRLTNEAYNRWVLVAPGFLQQLGIVNERDSLGINYYDMSGSTVYGRERNSFEQEKERMPSAVESLSAVGWLMRGAIREDDAYGESNPQDDSYPANATLRRPLHHFYDPYKNQALNVPLLSGLDSDVHKSPDWALGTRDVFNDPNTPEANRRNHFTVLDAREAMYRALTGLPAWSSAPMTPGGTAVTEAVRKAYWATTFRALGDVVHLIQDAAQPQHTRNEMHAGRGPGNLTGYASVYEKYVNDVAIGAAPVKIDCGSPATLTALTYTGYNIPVFNKLSGYWSTSLGGLGTGGAGLAEYSNRGFFTPLKNIDDLLNGYPSPPKTASAFTLIDAPLSNPCFPGTKTRLLTRAVIDTADPTKTAANVPLTATSVWDDIFRSMPAGLPAYHLNRYNYDAMANLLIPRAVAYSAGLINHFFRGRMTISLPDEGVYGVVDHAVENAKDTAGFRNIKLKIKNTTPDIIEAGTGTAFPQNMGGGSLVLVAKFHRNTCYEGKRLSGEFGVLGKDWHSCRSSEEEIVVSNILSPSFTLSAGEEKVVWFTLPVLTPIPINATDLYLQVVYRGILGAEQQSVVVATKDVSEPTYFSIENFRTVLFMPMEQAFHRVIRSP